MNFAKANCVVVHQSIEVLIGGILKVWFHRITPVHSTQITVGECRRKSEIRFVVVVGYGVPNVIKSSDFHFCHLAGAEYMFPCSTCVTHYTCDMLGRVCLGVLVRFLLCECVQIVVAGGNRIVCSFSSRKGGYWEIMTHKKCSQLLLSFRHQQQPAK